MAAATLHATNKKASISFFADLQFRDTYQVWRVEWMVQVFSIVL